jgi:hypothetical protein
MNKKLEKFEAEVQKLARKMGVAVSAVCGYCGHNQDDAGDDEMLILTFYPAKHKKN